jgi:toluene monooxygenase system protein D
MIAQQPDSYDYVGPVLKTGLLSDAIIAAIRELNKDVLVVDRGAYLRVLVPKSCVVTRVGIENQLGRTMRFPGELETVMSSFKGTIHLTQDEAIWRLNP